MRLAPLWFLQARTALAIRARKASGGKLDNPAKTRSRRFGPRNGKGWGG